MLTKMPRKKMVLNLSALKVETLVMPAAAPIRAITTSQYCSPIVTEVGCATLGGECTYDTEC